MANDKVFSARADEATIERLNAVAEQSGMKKSDLLPALLEAYESNCVRQALPGRTTEIDNFHSLLSQVERAYTGSLELNVNAENRIREEYEARIISNEEAVQALRSQLAQAKEAVDVAKAAQQEAEAKAKTLDDNLARVTDTLATIKESLANANAAKDSNERRIIDLEAKLTDLPEIKAKADAAAATISQLQAEAAQAVLDHKQALLEARERAADARDRLRTEMAQKAEEAEQRAEKRHQEAMRALIDHLNVPVATETRKKTSTVANKVSKKA